jgi:hypothetical protein
MSTAYHAWQRRAGEAGYCANMDAYQLIDDTGLDVDEAPVSAEACVVYEKRKPIVRDLQLKLRQRIGIGEVGCQRLGFSSGPTQFFGERHKPLSASRDQD